MATPVLHWEMWSRDASTLSTFYQRVFDWQVQHMPQIAYRMVDTGAGAGINGGIMEPMEGPLPGNLTFYIDVDDLGSYRQKVVEAGGSIVVEEQEIPGMGKLSLFADPEGRVLGMWQRNAT